MLTNKEIKKINEIKSRYPDEKAVLLPLLWMIQEKYGWISGDAMRYAGDLLNMPYENVLGVVTFYTMFNKQPGGKFHLQVCTNISCMLRGGYELFKYIEDKLKSENSDSLFTIEEVECLGSCATAPMMQVNNKEFYENLTKEKVDEIIGHFRNSIKEEI